MAPFGGDFLGLDWGYLLFTLKLHQDCLLITGVPFCRYTILQQKVLLKIKMYGV